MNKGSCEAAESAVGTAWRMVRLDCQRKYPRVEIDEVPALKENI